MRIIEKLISLMGVEVIDSSVKTTSQELLQETFKNKSKKEPILVKRYSPKKQS